MPIYEYACAACGHRLEAIQKFSDSPLEECPTCRAKTLKRLVSAPAFHLKGSGWYVTDFKDKSSAKPKETTAADTPKTEASSAESSAKKGEFCSSSESGQASGACDTK